MDPRLLASLACLKIVDEVDNLDGNKRCFQTSRKSVEFLSISIRNFDAFINERLVRVDGEIRGESYMSLQELPSLIDVGPVGPFGLESQKGNFASLRKSVCTPSGLVVGRPCVVTVGSAILE